MKLNTLLFHTKGFSLIELLAAIVITALLLAAMHNVINPTLEANQAIQLKNNTIQAARFTMDKMVRAVSRSPNLLIPYNEKSTTAFPDNIREQTNPASPPPPGSSLATAVLALTQDPAIDLDGNGVADVDNDADGKIDEDFPGDMTNDAKPGIRGIDDDGDGQTDEGFFADQDDDEVLNASNEDPVDGVDNDGDNNIDEDPPADMNNDGAPGIAGVDDDGDGVIDEGSNDDDDEDGLNNEDWVDPVVFYMQGGAIIERTPVPWDENASGSVTGEDYVETVLAENVSRFRVERITQGSNRNTTVELTLEITPPDGEMFSLTTRVRVGGAL
jgi:prepilin-type N-terminal cleavage/methylation domain-containing protein